MKTDDQISKSQSTSRMIITLKVGVPGENAESWGPDVTLEQIESIVITPQLN